MLSAWDVYWVMQLDSIGVALTIGCTVVGIGAGVALFVGAVAKSMSNAHPEMEMSKRERATGEALHRAARPLCVIAGALFCVNALIPSTKTAAAMIVAAAIANNETLHRDAGELYGLAKDALREAIRPGAAKASDPAK